MPIDSSPSGRFTLVTPYTFLAVLSIVPANAKVADQLLCRWQLDSLWDIYLTRICKSECSNLSVTSKGIVNTFPIATILTPLVLVSGIKLLIKNFFLNSFAGFCRSAATQVSAALYVRSIAVPREISRAECSTGFAFNNYVR